MFYQNFVRILFRNQKVLEIYTNEAKVDSHPRGPKGILTIDGKIVAHLKDPIADPLENGKIQIGLAYPQKELYNFFPEDWNKEESGFKLIDSILIDSNGRVRDER